jgi:hypothetical protein
MQCHFCGCHKVAYQWFGGTVIFTCGTWSGSTSIRGDRCYENEIAALVLRCQDAEKRVAELEAERAVLVKGVLAAKKPVNACFDAMCQEFQNDYESALDLAKAASEPAKMSPLAEKVQRMREAVKEVPTWGIEAPVRSATAINSIAAVVEELAKEGNP